MSVLRVSRARARRAAAEWIEAYVEGMVMRDVSGWDDGEVWFVFGYVCRYGLIEGWEMDEGGVMECLRRAAELGDAAAYDELGFMYVSGWDGMLCDGVKSVLYYYFVVNVGSV